MAVPVWRFYEAPGGGSPVRKDIRSAFQDDKPGKVRLGALMDRIANRTTLPRDVKDLGGGLCEGRLTHDGREFRLFFARCDGGLVLLALHFVGKKGRTIPQEIDLARRRLANWNLEV